jgi:hypothetical protein
LFGIAWICLEFLGFAWFCLVLLGLIRPIRAFSMGYSEKNKIIPHSVLLAAAGPYFF